MFLWTVLISWSTTNPLQGIYLAIINLSFPIFYHFFCFARRVLTGTLSVGGPDPVRPDPDLLCFPNPKFFLLHGLGPGPVFFMPNKSKTRKFILKIAALALEMGTVCYER
jgi:hypothetical protein